MQLLSGQKRAISRHFPNILNISCGEITSYRKLTGLMVNSLQLTFLASSKSRDTKKGKVSKIRPDQI